MWTAAGMSQILRVWNKFSVEKKTPLFKNQGFVALNHRLRFLQVFCVRGVGKAASYE